MSRFARPSLALALALSACKSGGEAAPKADDSSEATPAEAEAETKAKPETTPEARPPASPDEPPPGALVVLDENALAYAEASTEAPSFRIGGKTITGRGRLAEVVGRRDGFYELKTLAPKRAPLCAGSWGLEGDFALRFFVEPAALREILTKAKRVAGEDGATLAFEPGVPIHKGARGEALQVGFVQFEVAIADDERGRWMPNTVDPEAQLTLPGPELMAWTQKSVGYTLAGAEPRTLLGAELRIHAPVEAEGDTVTFAGPCGRFTLVARPEDGVDRKDFDPERADKLAGILGKIEARPGFDDRSCDPKPWTLPAGAQLRWRGGGVAGETRRAYPLLGEVERVERGDEALLCFEAEGIGLCVPAALAERKPNPMCLDGDPRGGPGGSGK